MLASKQVTRHNYFLDLLRCLAASSVLIYHYTYRAYAADNLSPLPFLSLAPITKYGYLGVQLFFIVSGYVVLMSAESKTVRQFLISRISRLYPAFWIACTVTFLVKLLFLPGVVSQSARELLHVTPLEYIYNMTMFHELAGITQHVDGAYWTLSIEIVFYFLISLIIGYRLFAYLDYLIAAWLLYAIWPGLPHHGAPLPSLFFPGYAPFFAAGILFYQLHKPATSRKKLLRYGLLAFAFLASLKAGLGEAAGLSMHFKDTFSPIVVAVFITVIFGVFYSATRPNKLLLQYKWFATLGSLTYPLYLLHSDIGFIIFHRLGNESNKNTVLATTIIIMFALAWLLHRFVEKPLGKRLAKFTSELLSRVNSV
ncbi:Peptidoglycan/LPS O-acetylase OafA/YrhL, contains acyltransferase and SGNH-hydrolase domains [Hymenobacter gelipurpurascens]|uniref:Peptidoglycan/LPS O-acetylase OafA/YrhL, contains acyltransferase and SGNH-hydrolase domains n=1 Tax=Hymenobacter gelipurpurascens TaxID=89968 RepID=A0A212TNF1_9BACT|nr:acyltransferase [Hymenobacter gelipurpurascens]SNC67361.1 Peptidoglycan/LPS O-acetylase OafA/YrhL, contains acyltransferase and SGNH-hydrolase domains [Hymenobacter gelipurpurascens]